MAGLALLPFYAVVFGLPVLAAAFVFFAGIGHEDVRGRHLLVWSAVTAALVAGAVQVRRADGSTSYAGFLRNAAVVAVVGLLLGGVRAARQRRARRAAQPSS